MTQFWTTPIDNEHAHDEKHSAQQDDSEDIISSDPGMRNRAPRYARQNDTCSQVEDHFQYQLRHRTPNQSLKLRLMPYMRVQDMPVIKYNARPILWGLGRHEVQSAHVGYSLAFGLLGL